MSDLFSHPHGTAPVDRTAELEAAAPEIIAIAEALQAPEHDIEHEYAVPVAAPPPPEHAPPQPMHAGTFAVYPDGAGGVVLVLQLAPSGETMHHRIPAAMIKMAERFGGAGISGVFGGMFGGK